MKPSRFLVTGGTGFLGAALVGRLVSEGHFVRVLDNGFRSSPNRIGDVLGAIELVNGDIRDRDLVIQSCEGIDCIVHLAAINGTHYFYEQPELVLDVGVRGMLNVIDGCIKHNVEHLTVASSSEVYQTPLQIPTDETTALVIPDPLNPRYSYGGSKLISELLALNYGRNHFKKVTIFRPHNVYGPNMGYGHVLPQFIMRAIENIEKHPTGPVPFMIQGNGLQTRSFVYIDDMVDGMMTIIKRGEHMNIYHIGNPEEFTTAEIAKKVVSSFNREILLQPSALLQGSTERRCPNIKKMQALGYSPKVCFDEGLARVIEWYTVNATLGLTKN